LGERGARMTITLPRVKEASGEAPRAAAE